MTKLVNRAKMSTMTVGTGTMVLLSAEAGYQSFADAGVVDGDVVRYVIEDGTNWEIGTGTYTALGLTLTRTVSESSNADAALNLSGSAVVYVSATAEDIPPVLELYAENPSSPTAPVATGTNAVAIGSQTEATGSESFAAGFNATATAYRALALGHGANAGNTSVALGTSANASGAEGNALGRGATASGGESSAFGHSSVSIGTRSTALTRSYASGTDSFAAAIANNTASYGATGANSVAIGQQARATQTTALSLGASSNASGVRSISIGSSNASGTDAVAIGFTAAAVGSGLALGVGAKANVFFSSAMLRGSTNVAGQFAYSGSLFASVGDAQGSARVLIAATTNDTPTTLTQNAAPNTTNQIILPNNSAYAFHGTIVARQQASQGTACAAWKIEGLIRREGNAASTVLVNSATTVLDNTPGWGMALSADTTNGGLKIEVTGAAATNIRWVATCHTSEVTF